MAATPNLLYTYNFIKNGANGDSVDDLPTGGAAASEANDVGDNAGILYGLAADSAAGVYFVTAIKGDDSYIYEEHFGQTALSLTPLGGGPVATTLANQVSSLALNASDDILYFTSGTGFYEEKFTGANFTGTPTKIQLATLPTSSAGTDDQLVFDQADHSAYFAAPAGANNFTTITTAHGKQTIVNEGGVTQNFIYKVSNVTSGATANSLGLAVKISNLGGLNGELPLSDGKISGVALDSATDTLYIITKPGTLPASTNVEGLYAYKISTSSLTPVWSQNDPSGNNVLNDMTNITIDPATGNYYVSVDDTSTAPGIYEGNVGSSAHPTRILALPGPVNNVASGDATGALVIDAPPTVASAAVKAIDGATNRTTGTVTTADTVTLSVTFSQNIFVTNTPTLTLNDGGVATYVGGSGGSTITFNYTPASGQNISALATTGAVSGGSFADSAGTAADLTNLAQTFAGLRVQTTPPVVNANGSVQYSEIGSPVVLDPGLTVSDPNGSGQLQSATVQISNVFLTGDVLGANVAGTNITPSYNGNGLLTLTGADTLAHYQTVLDSVTYSSTAPDATEGGADTSRTITWSVNDGVFSNVTMPTSTVNIMPCFVRGARILTERGDIEVENLAVGDLVVTASGRRRPIVWIGRRTLDLARHPDPVAVQPVRVRADAFGEGLPRRDLWLSPGHNLAFDGALIAASLLVNGRSVAQIAQDRVEYWHVELDVHDILLAEGLPAESYLDTGNRTAFAGGGAFVEAHPDFKPRHWAQTCLPLAWAGPAVSATKARLLARLAAEGDRLERDAEPHALVDGGRVEPISLTPTRLAFVLPIGGRQIALRSKVFIPAHTVADNMDTRELGLCVARLQIDGERVPIEADEERLLGWREPEYLDGIFSHRWTTGVTPLPAGARVAIIDLAGAGHYWLDCKKNVAAKFA